MLSLDEHTPITDVSDDRHKGASILRTFTAQCAPASLPGGHSVGVPPDPIPNSAVKPDCADGTIAQAMEE
jgi:hypothetical protein